jgi:hypothetical protein
VIACKTCGNSLYVHEGFTEEDGRWRTETCVKCERTDITRWPPHPLEYVYVTFNLKEAAK